MFSRQVVGWSMQPRMHVDLVLNALLMAVWQRKPKNQVVIHSDQGSQYTSSDWQEARQDIFNYIEMFYNPVRRHSYANDLSPVELNYWWQFNV